MAQEGVYVFPDSATGRSGVSDIADLAALSAMGGNGGFGGMNNPLWMMFMYPLILPFLNMFGGGFGGFGGFGGNGANLLGTGFLSNQLNNNNDKETILNALQYNSNAIAQLAQQTGNSISDVRQAVDIANSKLSELGGTVGMTGLQVVNAIQSGDANLARQLCECCCENRLAIVNQTNALQSQAASNASNAQLQLASHDANVRLQLAQNEAADQLSVCQQTNTLATQNERNTNSIINAIAAQTTTMTKEFCELKERELQNKIDSLTADNALLRSNINTNAQTQQFAAMLAPINAELASIKAHQPQTITLPYNQYSVVPTWAANVGADFVASYWANRLSSAVAPTTTTTGTGTTA